MEKLIHRLSAVEINPADLDISKAEATELLDEAGVDSSLRAQELSLEQWFKLYNKLYN